MSNFETRQGTFETISHANFTQTAANLMNEAIAVETPLERGMELAQDVSNRLDDIGNGKLIVEPPLSEDEFASYRVRSTDIIILGQKALNGIKESQQTSKMSRRERRKQEKAQRKQQRSTFTGNASSSKS